MKLALCFSGGRRPAAADLAAVRRMLAAMQADAPDAGPWPGGAVQVEGGALGWLHTSDRDAPVAMARQNGSGDVLLAAGVPVQTRGPAATALEETLARALGADVGEAERLLTSLDGGFAAARWHAASGTLQVVTDFMGFQPLHAAQAGAGGPLVIATEIKAVVASGAVGAEPDAAAWGAFVGFGHALGNSGPLADVRRVDPGTALRYAVRGAAPARPAAARAYWRWPEPSAVRSADAVDAGALVAALDESVAAYGAYQRPGVVLLSGGFDSRLVLSLLRRAGLPTRAVLVRQTDKGGDSEGRLAERVARRLGVDYEVHVPPPDYYAGAGYRRYLARTEVANPSLELSIPRVASAIRPEFGAVWEGIAPNAMQRLIRNPANAGFDAYLGNACRPRGAPHWRAMELAFRRDWVDACYDAHHGVLAEERARHRDDEFGVFEFAVRNRTRHRLAANPFAGFAHEVLAFTPGVTRRFFDATYSLSGHVLGKSAVRLRIFREFFPDAAVDPFDSGGTLIAGTGRLPLEVRLLQLYARFPHRPRVRGALRAVLGAAARGPLRYDRDRAASAALGVPLLEAALADPHVDHGRARALLAARPAGEAERRARLHLFHWLASRRLLGGAAAADAGAASDAATGAVAAGV